MAENEILDIKGTRWRKTRRLLIDPNSSLPSIADCAVQEFENGVRRALNATLHKGVTLLTMLKAAAVSQSAMRGVVATFKDQQLIGIVAQAVKICGVKSDMASIAKYAGQLLIDSVIDRAVLYAHQCEAYSTNESINALRYELAEKFERYQPGLVDILESSLCGKKVRGPARARTKREPIEIRAKSLIGISLRNPAKQPSDISNDR